MPNWKKVIVSGSDATLNSLIVTNGITGSLFGTASWANNALTSSNIQGGTQYYVPVWNTNTSLSSSYLYQSGSILKTIYSGLDKGLTLDYNIDSFILGNAGTGNNTYIQVYDGGSVININTPNYTYFSEKVGIRIIPTNPGLAVSGALEVTGPGTSKFMNNNVQIDGNLFMSGSNRLIYNDSTTNSMLFGFFDGGNIYGPYYQIFGNQYSNVTQRGSAEFVYDNRNGGGSGFNIASFNGSTWTRKFRVDDDGAQVTGSLIVTNGITGSLFGTASWALNAVTSSYAQTASYANDFTVAGTLTAQTIIVQVITSSTELITGSLTVSGSLNALGGVTGSLFGTASWANNAITASHAVSALSSSYAITASYAATASSALNASDILVYVKNSTGTQINKGTVVRIAGAVGDNPLISTASYTDDNNSANTLGITNETIPNDSFGYVITEGKLLGIDTNIYSVGQLLYLGLNGAITGSAPHAPLHAVRLGQVLRVQQNNGSMYVRIDNGYELGELHDVRDTTTTSSYGDLLVKSGSIWINSKQLTGSYGLTGSLTTTSFTGSLQGTSSWAIHSQTSSYADSFIIGNNATISGSLTIFQNLTVFGSASITYVSESTLNIGTNLITVNTNTPSVRFGGLAVIDSGSSPQISGSWLFDSVQNRWIFIHEQSVGGSLTSSIGIMGPETYNNLGNETQLTLNRLTKGYSGISGEHIGDSQISDDGTTVSIPGRLVVTGSITGSLFGTSSWAQNAVTSSYILQAVSASFATLAQTANTASFVTASNVFGPFGSNSVTSASFAVTSSFAQTASFIPTSSLVGNFFVQGGNSFGTQATLGTNDTQNLAFETNGSVRMIVSGSNGFVGVATTVPSYSLDVNGTFGTRGAASIGGSGGIGSSTTWGLLVVDNGNTFHNSAIHCQGRALYLFANPQATTQGAYPSQSVGLNSGASPLVLISNSTERMRITAGGLIGINNNNPSFTLDVSGSTRITNNLIASGSTTITGSLTLIGNQINTGSLIIAPSGTPELQVTSTGLTIGNIVTDIHTVTGSLNVSGSSTIVGRLTANDITGSLFGTASWAQNAVTASYILNAVSASFASTASFSPIFTISSSLYSAQGATATAGTTVIASIPTSSYRAGFFDYTVFNVGNARAGTVMSTWNGSSVQFTDTSTTDIGATNSVTMSVALNGGNVELRTTAGTTWTVRTTYRLI